MNATFKLVNIAPRLISALAGAIVLLLPVLSLARARPGDPVIVVGLPWTGPGGAVAIIARAEGMILRDTMVRWIAVGRSDIGDFEARLHRAGAWITLDASWAMGCRSPARS